jgi:hypothetical protein
MRWIAMVLAALALAGCAGGGTPVDTKDETLSLVYGYFDMADAPSKVDWVRLKDYTSKAEADGYTIAAKDGLFFHIGVEPGSYQVESFGSDGGFLSSPVRYSFGGKGRNNTAVRIQKPGLYYLGSHKYIKHPGKGFFDPDRFDMQPAKTPSEKEVLQRLVQRIESDKSLGGYTRQLQLAKKRLAEL